MVGKGARSPVRKRSPNAVAKVEKLLRMEPASEMRRSSVSDWVVSRWLRPANCASANCTAKPVMSTPLPIPREEAIEEAEILIAMITTLRLAD